MSDQAYVKASAAGYGNHPPAHSYAPKPVDAAYAAQPAAPAYTGGPSYGAPQYGAQAQYGGAPAAVGFAQPVAPQTVQVNVSGATVPPVSTIVFAQSTGAVISSPTYLGWSIFNLLCCFWPLGMAALMFSMKVSNARSTDESRAYSLTARNLNIAATVIAPVLVVVIVGSVLGSAATVTADVSGGIAQSCYYYYDSYYRASASLCG